jgi:ubiquinone/menaquinone biosynthesis C-methylase UbiE
MLSLERQNRYREQYKTMRPGWRTSGEVYETAVRRALLASGAQSARDVLDVGCGAGGVMEVLSREVRLAVGIDVDLPSLQGHRDQTHLLAASDLARLPFPANSFDLVVSSWVLEHLQEPREALAEVARVLRPGGHFVFLTPNAHNLITWLNRLVPRLAQSRLVAWLYGRQERDTFPVVYRANSIERLSDLAAAVGLQPDEVVLVSDPSYLAFNDFLFGVSVLLERLTPERNFVHLVGDYVKTERG